MSDYEEYVHNQTVVHGQIEKPEKYLIGQKKAIDFFFDRTPESAVILDVGCGSGEGMTYLKSLGYENVYGIELHPVKAEIAGAYCGDVATFKFDQTFDVIFSSHSFEHMFDPDKALKNLLVHSAADAKFFFVLPYPDTGPDTGHPAGEQLGLRIEDDGKTVIKFFEDRGLTLHDARFDDFREPEIWMEFWRIP